MVKRKQTTPLSFPLATSSICSMPSIIQSFLAFISAGEMSHGTHCLVPSKIIKFLLVSFIWRVHFYFAAKFMFLNQLKLSSCKGVSLKLAADLGQLLDKFLSQVASLVGQATSARWTWQFLLEQGLTTLVTQRVLVFTNINRRIRYWLQADWALQSILQLFQKAQFA